MKHYVLIKDNEILQHYNAEIKPSIHINKGIIYEYIEEAAPVPLSTQKVEEGYEVQGDKYVKVFTIVDKTEYEILMESWLYPEYQKKIIAPISLIFEGTGLAMKAWFDLNDLPIKKVGDIVELYCNEILPAHADIVTQLQGVITIEDKPTEI